MFILLIFGHFRPWHFVGCYNLNLFTIYLTVAVSNQKALATLVTTFDNFAHICILFPYDFIFCHFHYFPYKELN